MTDPNKTLIAVLLDRSGSMMTIAEDVRGGFNAFIDEQRATEGECLVTLAQFDNEYNEVYTDVPVADVPPLALEPRGSTALLDSMGKLITAIGAKLSALPEDQRPGSVIVAIMTDGQENASREWTHAAIKKLVSSQTDDYGWQFLYMGANQDAVEEGAKIGVSAANSITYTGDNAAEVLRASSSNVASYRGLVASGMGNLASVGYSTEQRDAVAR